MNIYIVTYTMGVDLLKTFMYKNKKKSLPRSNTEPWHQHFYYTMNDCCLDKESGEMMLSKYSREEWTNLSKQK